MRKSPLLIIMTVLLMLTLASAAVFGQEVEDPVEAEVVEEVIDETDDTGEPEVIDEPVADYIEYPCVDENGDIIESPLTETEDEEATDETMPADQVMLQLVAQQEVEDPVDEEVEVEVTEEVEIPTCTPVPTEVEPEEPVGPPPPPINPWYGQYWNNPTFSGVPAMQRSDDYVDFNWGNESPNPDVMGSEWNSMRWTHTEPTLERGFYRIRIQSDYGARLDVNGARLVDTIRYGDTSAFDTYYWIRGGLSANYRFDYFHHAGPSTVSINIEKASEWAAPFGYGTVAGTPVLRDGPGTEYYSNGRLAAGESVKLTGHRNLPGNWVGVITDLGEAGWLSTASVFTNYPVEKMQIWPFTPDAVRGGEPRGTISRNFPYVNVRYQPTSQSQVIAQAPQGMSVALIGRTTSNNYLLVRMWEGTLGWAPRGGIDTTVNISSLPIRYDDSVATAE